MRPIYSSPPRQAILSRPVHALPDQQLLTFTLCTCLVIVNLQLYHMEDDLFDRMSLKSPQPVPGRGWPLALVLALDHGLDDKLVPEALHQVVWGQSDVAMA